MRRKTQNERRKKSGFFFQNEKGEENYANVHGMRKKEHTKSAWKSSNRWYVHRIGWIECAKAVKWAPDGTWYIVWFNEVEVVW